MTLVLLAGVAFVGYAGHLYSAFVLIVALLLLMIGATEFEHRIMIAFLRETLNAVPFRQPPEVGPEAGTD